MWYCCNDNFIIYMWLFILLLFFSYSVYKASKPQPTNFWFGSTLNNVLKTFYWNQQEESWNSSWVKRVDDIIKFWQYFLRRRQFVAQTHKPVVS